MEWLIVVAVLIALAFGVVLFRTYDPKQRARQDADAKLPLEDVGTSDLDEED